MRLESQHRKVFISFVLCCFIFLQNRLLVKAETTYTGNIENTNYGASAGSGQSASASVDLIYGLPNLIAMVFQDSSGQYPRDSIFDALTERSNLSNKGNYVFDNSTALFKHIINNDDSYVNPSRNIKNNGDTEGIEFWIPGILFSSSRSIGSISLSTSNQGTHTNAIKMINLDTLDDIECSIVLYFREVIIPTAYLQKAYLNQAISQPNPLTFDQKGFAGMVIRGDIYPSTVTVQDRSGSYVGSLTVSISNL